MADPVLDAVVELSEEVRADLAERDAEIAALRQSLSESQRDMGDLRRSLDELRTLSRAAPERGARGIAEAGVVGRDLVLRFTDGTTQNVGRVLGEKGEPGLNGRDAVGTAGEPGRSVQVSVQRSAPHTPRPGDVWIVP